MFPRWEDRRCADCGEPDNPVDGVEPCRDCKDLLCARCMVRHDERHAYARERSRSAQYVSENYPEAWLQEEDVFDQPYDDVFRQP